MPTNSSRTIPVKTPSWVECDPRSRCRPAYWISFPGRKDAGIFERKGLWRIRCGKSAIWLEYLVDVLDLRSAACEHRDANKTSNNEVSASSLITDTRPRTGAPPVNDHVGRLELRRTSLFCSYYR